MSDAAAVAEPEVGDLPIETHADDAAVESRARTQGWRPKEEYKGPPERWFDAKTFVENAEKFLPVANERNRRLEEMLERSQAEARKFGTELAEVKQVLTDYRDFASRSEQRAFERAMRELQDRRTVAVQNADTETFKTVDKEIAELEKTRAPAAPKTDPVNERERERERPRQDAPATPDPAITSWIGENPWFNSDPLMNAFAVAVDADLMKNRPGMEVRDRLAEVKTEVRRRFPEKFSNPRREQGSAVASPNGSAAPPRSKGRGYEDLPPEAKKACDKFVKQIPGFKREDYLRDYDWAS